MPATWKDYGVDGNKDGLTDPYNPVDAIFAAARYLKAAGADKDIRGAVYAYNHADWYVDSVLLRAQVIGGMPANLVGSLTGPHRGPLPGRRRGHLRGRGHQAQPQDQGAPTRAVTVESSATAAASRSTPTPARRSSRSATSQRDQDRRLQAPRPLRPGPGRLRQHVHVRAPGQDLPALRRAEAAEGRPGRGQAPARAARSPTRSRRRPRRTRDRPASRASRQGDRDGRQGAAAATATTPPRRRAAVKERLFAHPTRSNAMAAGGAQQEFLRTGRIDGALTPARALGLARDQIVIKQLKVGSQVPAGTVLGRIGTRLLGQAPARALRDPPGRPRRPAHRPEADPRRLEAARVDRDLPRQGQEPVRRPRRRDADDRPDPADEQGDADAARPRRPADPDLRLRPPGHPGRRDRPPRARHARVPRRLRLQPDDHLAALRPLLPDRRRATSPSTRPAPRSTSPPSTASRSSATRARARSPTSSSSAC